MSIEYEQQKQATYQCKDVVEVMADPGLKWDTKSEAKQLERM